jgi:hypothetical protein
MWHTQAGDRTLRGAEAQVFAASLATLISDTNLSPEFDDYELGIPVFDNLTYNQKITILLVITKGLFREDATAINLTALNEAAIAAVFENLKFNLQEEIDHKEDNKYWRTFVINALIELDYEDIPNAKEIDPDEWDLAIGFLFDQILWDTDYLMDDLMDDPPEVANRIKKEFGIYHEYFTDIVEDPNNQTIDKYLLEIKQICSKIL